MKILLAARNPDFGNCVGIYKSLLSNEKVSKVFPVFKKKDGKGFYKEIIAEYGFDKIKNLNVDKAIIVGSKAFYELEKDLKKINEIRVVLTGSFYLENYEVINRKLNNHIVYCMPSLKKYCQKGRVFHHPFEFEENKISKSKRLTVSHSPNSGKKARQKGSDFIKQVVGEISKDISLKYDLITGMSWKDAIQRKAKSHIFVDQIVNREREYKGGLGKSGIEAIFHDCVVFTSGKSLYGYEIPPPPIVRVNKDNFKDKLIKYCLSKEERWKQIKQQKEWANKYLNYKFMGEYLLS